MIKLTVDYKRFEMLIIRTMYLILFMSQSTRWNSAEEEE